MTIGCCDGSVAEGSGNTTVGYSAQWSASGARIAPSAEQANYLLAWEASPLQSYFRYARDAGEQSARRQLPQLLARLQLAGMAPRTIAAEQTVRRCL